MQRLCLAMGQVGIGWSRYPKVFGQGDLQPDAAANRSSIWKLKGVR
jgi:hypothetical protein